MSVKVGVRVRPFNKRQIQLGAKLCVQMQGTVTHLLEQGAAKRSFNYDYSFWSHDGFRVDQDGYSHPEGQKYADQRHVYNQIGSGILTNAWQGYNCCLFAYGQTGSGKSYSMIGYGANKGLIPIICNSIFEKINQNSDGTRSFQVKISMLEIYNEAIRDLLPASNRKQQLKICQHKTLGVYVDGLAKHGVDSYEKIQNKIQEGSNNRSIAATLMNQSSSRSHTIVSISFVQKIQVSIEQTSVKYSNIYLVDLAGSQCVAKTGVNSKDRLRQTAKINQSLTTLGRVIQILADNCGKKDKQKQFVPYRDSKLTFILRNALGGNSRTAMICAISPADDNFQETLSTLRYASRAKKIQNKAIVNESDVDKLIRQLRQQNQMLKKLLQQARSGKSIPIQPNLTFNNEKDEQISQISQNIAQQSLFQGLQDEKDENLLNQTVNMFFVQCKVNQKLPYLTNISEDQLLSLRIKYSCQKLMIGNKKGNPKPDVVLNSPGVEPNHAFISYNSELKKAYLQLLDDNACNYTYLNGTSLGNHSKTQLFNLDRLVFGTGCVFLYIFKDSPSRNQNIKLQDIDYQFAIGQIQNTQKIQAQIDKRLMIQQQAIRKKVVMQIEQQFEKAKKQKQQILKKQIQERQKDYNQKIRQIQQAKSVQTKRLQKQLQQRQQKAKALENEKINIKKQMEIYLSLTQQNKQKQQQSKQQLQQARLNYQQKLKQMNQLEQRMKTIEQQTLQKRTKIEEVEIKKQQQIKKQIQIQTTICNNQNILSQYKQEQNKRTKNAKQVKDLLIKKQRIFLNKQLVQLIPQVEKFNLIAKQMGKKVQCGLSIQYRYISEAEIIQVIKTNNYKAKLKITLHVINRDQGRAYYWPLQTFQNRYQHALELWDRFIREGSRFKYTRQTDPFWDPEDFQTVAHAYLTLQCLMFGFSYTGQISFVKGGKKVGKINTKIYPSDAQGNQLTQGQQSMENYKLLNPHENIQKTLYFVLQLSCIQILDVQCEYDTVKIYYELLQNIKTVKYSSQPCIKDNLPKFKYRKIHILKQLSQISILNFMQNPLGIQLQLIPRVTSTDELTSRSQAVTVGSNSKSSFSAQMEQQNQISSQFDISNFQDITPPKKQNKAPNNESFKKPASGERKVNFESKQGVIYQNTQITRKVQQQYQRKKKQDDINSKKKEQKLKKQKQCQIY